MNDSALTLLNVMLGRASLVVGRLSTDALPIPTTSSTPSVNGPLASCSPASGPVAPAVGSSSARAIAGAQARASNQANTADERQRVMQFLRKDSTPNLRCIRPA